MRNIGHRKAEMKPRRVAHGAIAGRDVGMDAERRLHISKCGNDDAPDILGRIERQNATVPGSQPAHHIRLASRPERLTGRACALDSNERVDDLTALDQQTMHLGIDTVDVLPQVRQPGGISLSMLSGALIVCSIVGHIRKAGASPHASSHGPQASGIRPRSPICKAVCFTRPHAGCKGWQSAPEPCERRDMP